MCNLKSVSFRAVRLASGESQICERYTCLTTTVHTCSPEGVCMHVNLIFCSPLLVVVFTK